MSVKLFAFVAVFALVNTTASGMESEKEFRDSAEIPELFRGLWAEKLQDCMDKEARTVVVQSDGYFAYELTAKPLITTGQIKWSYQDKYSDPKYRVTSVRLLLAETGEGELAIGKMQLSVMNDRLYIRRLAYEEDKRILENPYLRCPAK